MYRLSTFCINVSSAVATTAPHSAGRSPTAARGSVGLLGRVVDSTHYYLLEIKVGVGGVLKWALTKRNGGTWTTLSSGQIDYVPGTWLRLRLTMTGTSLRAEASAEGTTFTTLGTATDGRYAAGRIGLRATWSVAYFDDVLVQPT